MMKKKASHKTREQDPEPPKKPESQKFVFPFSFNQQKTIINSHQNKKPIFPLHMILENSMEL